MGRRRPAPRPSSWRSRPGPGHKPPVHRRPRPPAEGRPGEPVLTEARRRSGGVEVWQRGWRRRESLERRSSVWSLLLLYTGHDTQQVSILGVRFYHKVGLFLLGTLGSSLDFLQLDTLQSRDPEGEQLVILVVRHGGVGVGQCCGLVVAESQPAFKLIV